MPTAAALSNPKSLPKGKAKASALATPVTTKPKVVKRKGGTGRRPGAKAWLIAEFLRLLRLIAGRCPQKGNDWIPLAEEHSADQETERSHKACQGKWDYLLKLKKPTGKSKPHPLIRLAHAIDKHIDAVSATLLVNDNNTTLTQEHFDSIEVEFQVAERDLEGLEDTVPDFDTAPGEEVTEVMAEENEEGEHEEQDAVDGEEADMGDGEVEDAEGAEAIEEFGPGEAPDGAEILEVIYQPPVHDPIPQARNSPIWDAEQDSQPSAEPPAQALPAKDHPMLFKHLVPSSSTANTSTGPSDSTKVSKPETPARFPLSKTKTESSTTPASKAQPKSVGKAVASSAKPTTSVKAVGTPEVKDPGGSKSKKRKLDEANPQQVLEYTVPKHTAGGKSVSQSSKRANTGKKKEETPAKKNAEVDDDIIDVSSSEEGDFISRLVNKKEASNLATVAVMDSKRELQLLREQLAEAHKKIKSLQEELQEFRIQKEVQKRLKALGVLNPAGPGSTSTAPANTPTSSTHSTVPLDITNEQFSAALRNYLDSNNLTIVDNWEVDTGPVFDPTHPFNHPDPTSDHSG